MKIAIKYEVLIADDEGNHIADAQASANVTSIEQLVNTVCAAITSVVSTIDSADNNPLESMKKADASADALFNALNRTVRDRTPQ